MLVVLLALAVPFQAALAVSAVPQAAVEQCHDSHDGHGKTSGPQCGACCTAIAIVTAVNLLPSTPIHGTVSSASALPPAGNPPDALDRPPRSL